MDAGDGRCVRRGWKDTGCCEAGVIHRLCNQAASTAEAGQGIQFWPGPCRDDWRPKMPGITIDYERTPTLRMHFSPKTGLIRKWKYVAEFSFQEAVEEFIVDKYKDFGVVMSVTKLTSFRNGKKFISPEEVLSPI